MKRYNDTKYFISPKGEVVNSKTGKHLKWSNNGKYYQVGLYINKKCKIMYVHRLVAILYIKNPHKKLTVNHKDGNRANNCVDNLEWCTQRENIQHAYDNGLSKKGEEHYISKLTEEHVRNIRLLYKLYANKPNSSGNRQKNGITQIMLSKYYKVRQNMISDIILRKAWKHI